ELAPLARRGRPFWLAPLEEPERDPLPAGAVELISREGEPPWRGRIAEHTRRLYRDKLARRHEALQARLVGWGGDFLALPAEEGISGLIGRIQARGRLLR
ncbi:MAG: hypothetical protein ACE5GW_12260, partial [Planctomycetota bacterium]